MHTYKKEIDGTYAVGQWLVGALEFKFMPLFYVSDRQNAIAAINALNGADLTAAPLYPDFRVIAEHEPKKRSHKGTFIWTAILIGFAIGIVYGCTRANATILWPEPVPVTLPASLHGEWCRGEGAYVRNVASCTPADRVTITSRLVHFHDVPCEVRTAVPHANTSLRMPRQWHISLWCRRPGEDHHAVHRPTTTAFYWLGLWRGGNLMITATDTTFHPLDFQRFLREYTND